MVTAQKGFLSLWLIIFLFAAAVFAGGVVYVTNRNTAPSPLHIPAHTLMASASPTPRPTLAATRSSVPTAPTPTPTPAPTIIPGARSTDWKTYRNYEWQFEIKIPPNWTVDNKYGIIISGDSAAIRIDTDGVGGNEGATTAPVITMRMVAGQQVEVGDGTFFSLKRDNADIPNYYFRINNWTDTVDKILSTFKSW